jgi:sensor domain CHASE-containing protein
LEHEIPCIKSTVERPADTLPHPITINKYRIKLIKIVKKLYRPIIIIIIIMIMMIIIIKNNLKNQYNIREKSLAAAVNNRLRNFTTTIDLSTQHHSGVMRQEEATLL